MCQILHHVVNIYHPTPNVSPQPRRKECIVTFLIFCDVKSLLGQNVVYLCIVYRNHAFLSVSRVCVERVLSAHRGPLNHQQETR